MYIVSRVLKLFQQRNWITLNNSTASRYLYHTAPGLSTTGKVHIRGG